MRLIFAVLLGGSALLLPLVPMVGEVVAIGLPALGLVAAVTGLVRHSDRPDVAAGCAAFALAAIAGTIAPWSPTDAPPPAGATVTIAAANLSARNDGQAAAAALDFVHPDVLVTIETPVLAIAALDQAYPHTVAAPPRRLGGVNVWSVHPLRPLPPLAGLERARVVAIAVDAPEPFTLVAAHLPRPWWRTRGLLGMAPALAYEVSLVDQRDIVNALTRVLADIDGPVVLAGDLNLTDRGWGYGRVTTVATDVMRAEWTAPTSTKLVFLPLRLRIDHIMVAGGWCGRPLPRVPLAGSDHIGVQARVGPCGG